MDKKAQKIAIAEFHGFRREESVSGSTYWSYPGYDFPVNFSQIPDYLNNLHAMQQVILKLEGKDTEFGAAVIKVLRLEHKHDFDVWKHATVTAIVLATPEQLAKALLITIGKWKEK